MDFALNEEQELFRNYIRKTLDDAGQTQIARKFIDGNEEVVQTAYNSIAELGGMGISISEDFGGMGLGAIDLIPIEEEIGRSLLPGVYTETMAFIVPILEKYGTQGQKEKYLTRISEGLAYGSIAWLEEKANFQPEDTKLKAEYDGQNYILNGSKMMVPISEQVDFFIVLARSSDRDEADSLSVFLVDSEDVTISQPLKCIDATQCIVNLEFHHKVLKDTQLVGMPHKGWGIWQEGLLHFNAALCSVMVGGMERVVEMAAEYAKIRVQFGQPIGRFQSIKHKIVDMKVELETARSLSYYANWAIDHDAADKEAAVYSARAFITQAFIRVASENIQIHGGIGFTEELDGHLYVKRARYYENYLGSVRDYREKAAIALDW